MYFRALFTVSEKGEFHESFSLSLKHERYSSNLHTPFVRLIVNAIETRKGTMTFSAIIPMLLDIVSIGLGFIVFYVFSNLGKDQKINLIRETLSQIINFVLFIWLSKSLLNLSLLFRDPLAMLAYPSGSKAFYLALLFSAGLIFYSHRKGRIDGWPFVESLWFTLLPAAFFYEFIRLIWSGDIYAFGGIILYGIMLIAFLGMGEKIPQLVASSILIALWTSGMMLGVLTQTYPTTFGYVIEPWFIFLFFTISQTMIYLNYKRRDTHECY